MSTNNNHKIIFVKNILKIVWTNSDCVPDILMLFFTWLFLNSNEEKDNKSEIHAYHLPLSREGWNTVADRICLISR